MKVLNVVSILSPLLGGGVAERIIQMSHYLAKNGVETSVLTLDYGLDDDTLKYLGDVRIIALSLLVRRFYIPFPNLKKINNAVRDSDVIHFSNHWGILNSLVFLSNLVHQKPYAVCPAGGLKIAGRSQILKGIYNKLVGYRIIRSASLCIAVVEEEVDLFLEYGSSADKIKVIPNGIVMPCSQLDESQPFRERYGVPNRFILFMGRLNPIKGIDMLVSAYCRIKALKFVDYDLVIAGVDEGLLPELTSIIQQAELSENIHFLGFVTGSDKQQAYASADLLVIPSRSEAMSIVVLEAAVHGTPVICTDQCGLSEFARQDCVAIVPATLDGIAEGLDAFFESRGRQEQGQRLKRYVTERFEWSSIVREYIVLYEKILGIARQ
jgi:glycosyltransferase involved in cell wall biosynthesis